MSTPAEKAAEKLAAPPDPEAVRRLMDDPATAAEAPSEAPPMDAVIIVRMKTPQGDITTDVIAQGNVEADQVQTLIELGLKTWRAKIGLA